MGGSANPICNRVKKFEVKDYKILDNNNEKGLHGDKWREPDEKIMSIEINTPDDYLKRYKGWADVVFCLEVFEYVADLYNAMSNIANMTKKRGVIYISISTAYPVHNPIASDSSRMTKEGFENLISSLRYDGIVVEILECIPRRYSPEAFKHIQEAWRIDGLRAAKGYPYHDVVGWIYKLKKI